jgi:hypothetical protein
MRTIHTIERKAMIDAEVRMREIENEIASRSFCVPSWWKSVPSIVTKNAWQIGARDICTHSIARSSILGKTVLRMVVSTNTDVSKKIGRGLSWILVISGSAMA